MKRTVLAALPILCLAGAVQAQDFSAEELTSRTVERRAVEAVIWGMPAVNLDLMLQAMIGSAKGKPNQIVYWSRLPDWKNQTLTPNPDVIYVMPFFDTKDAGPMVLEIPPADDGVINGTVMDAWQIPLEDVGSAGVDKGEGGKYLILPPGYSAVVPDGYIALPSPNYRGYALLRSILKSGSDSDIAKAVAYAKRIKVYPLSQASNPPPTTFVDAIDVVYDSTIPYDLRFFQSLDRVVQSEPWLARDKIMIGMLKSIGIEKGKPFDPDAKTRDVLGSAARESHALLEIKYEGMFKPYFDISHWALPAMPDYLRASSDGFSDPTAYPVDSRGLAFTFAFFTPKHLGQGQSYLMTTKDKDGQNFDGRESYRLSVPARVPVNQYWSVTVYDRATHGFIRSVNRSGRSSQSPGLQVNTDGSVDIWFGPSAPAGKDSNWVPTNPNGQFELLFRFYGPEKPLLDRTWKLPDVERVVAR
ncbi:Uncharacterized conserved protein [Rhizobiales bacterium GAS188]|nr:Uncharacterized conserved protein [Rhizobiales bacterium GAS188]